MQVCISAKATDLYYILPIYVHILYLKQSIYCIFNFLLHNLFEIPRVSVYFIIQQVCFRFSFAFFSASRFNGMWQVATALAAITAASGLLPTSTKAAIMLPTPSPTTPLPTTKKSLTLKQTVTKLDKMQTKK